MSSSLFPFLRSLLISPLKGDVQTATIQHTIEDRDRGGFTTPDRQQDHLSFHDTGLRGSQGALIVLEALATNPFAYKLTLSHNQLGDIGVGHLSNRIRFLKNRRTVLVHELNLASNSLTNQALSNLCSSWEGLKELYLSNNQINLRSIPSPLLNLGNLTLLSLTSNPIDTVSLSNLFRDPKFAPIQLTTLHLSACNLDLEVAVSLALWLEDHDRSAKLEWLAVNGNRWGTLGCERITWSLARKGGNCHLLRLEMLACYSSLSNTRSSDIDIDGDVDHHMQDEQYVVQLLGYRDIEDLQHCRKTIQDHQTWTLLLEKCQVRNQALRLATRRAALGLVSSARWILLSQPVSASDHDDDNNHQSSNNDHNKSKKSDIFPWYKLPEEIKMNIWRWVSILSAFPGLLTKPPATNTPISSSSLLLLKDETNQQQQQQHEVPDPLTVIQLTKLIQYAQDKTTLHEEIFQRDELIFNHNHSTSPSSSSSYNDHLSSNPNNHMIIGLDVDKIMQPPQDTNNKTSFHRQLVTNHRLVHEIDRRGTAYILDSCTCNSFLGNI